MAGPLNYHHLQYFWAVAKEGNLTRTAQTLRVSQSALSTQIRQLEEQLGQSVFAREGRRLVLTEAGRIAFAHAEEIFAHGAELVATLAEGRRRDQVLRVGAVATLSRNFQESFVKPLLDEADVRLRLRSGSLDELLSLLAGHKLDLVLSNHEVRPDEEMSWRCQRIARQQVSLVGKPRAQPFAFPRDLAEAPLLLPAPGNEIRTSFDALCRELKVKPRVLAEVDDMAMMRLLARDTQAVALIPTVVVRDELQRGVLVTHYVVEGLFENFYAITVDRHYEHPLLRTLLSRPQEEILAMKGGRQLSESGGAGLTRSKRKG
ncbi:MAG: LysR family transcriptional regulator [Myxococcales bacterium]|nr:LysR family transcriptional regulator [Myxococcales bacterium]